LNWIEYWEEFIEKYPDYNPPRKTKHMKYISDIRLGKGSWEMTSGFWEVVFSKNRPLKPLIDAGLYVNE
jgi:hypothetical protein